MAGLFSGIRTRLRDAVRSAAFGVAGVVFGLAGLAFLTAALWILLATYESPLVAFTVIGVLYLVLGFCFLALGTRQSDTHSRDDRGGETRPPSPAAREPLAQIAEGFAVGLQAGRSARGRP